MLILITTNTYSLGEYWIVIVLSLKQTALSAFQKQPNMYRFAVRTHQTLGTEYWEPNKAYFYIHRLLQVRHVQTHYYADPG